MELVTSKQVAKAINVDKFGFIGTFIGYILMKILRISTLNKIYKKHKNKKDLHFLNSLLNEFKIKFEIPEEDLKRLPKEGAFITVSNHPLGGIDGILLLKLLLEQRSDYKIIANFLLHKIEPLKEYIMPVNPFENRKDAKSSITGIKNALLHLKEGKPLGIFPAGEVSTFKDDKLIIDKPWEEGAIKLIKKAKVPVVPIYFHAKNSKLFYFLSKISGNLRTAKLPSELLSQQNKVIKVRIGKPISVNDQNEYTDINKFNEFLCKKTYMLANSFEEKPKHSTKTSSNKKVTEICEQKKPELFIKEIENLREENCLLLKSKNYEVLLAEADKIPNILNEIGRLREITFREVGEGTNNPLDLDEFDNYYHHLLLWDNDASKLAGAYRIGLGKNIYEKYGINGFYTNTLFNIDPKLYQMMQKTIELGRAFIIKEYQQKPMPLFLLWKGIVHTTLRFPEHKYIMGGVSISNEFSDFSKSLMVEFMKLHYYDPYVAQYIHPKNEYKVNLKDADKNFVSDISKSDLQKLDKIIDEIEPETLRIPVLFKKYIKQNAKILAFNTDPIFNNTIVGLMYIEIDNLPDSTVKPVMEEYQAELERKANKK